MLDYVLLQHVPVAFQVPKMPAQAVRATVIRVVVHARAVHFPEQDRIRTALEPFMVEDPGHARV